MSDYLNYYHNKGQEDAVNSDYDPPHGIIDELTTWSDSGMENNIEENKAYDEGYYHTRGQLNYNEGEYNPPSDSFCCDAYDSGYEGAKNNDLS